MSAVRLVMYARGTAEEIETQRAACVEITEGLAEYEIAATAADPPDGSDGWISANAMVSNGEVDRILIASRSVIPNIIESVTLNFHPGRRPRRTR
ncbi:hypothetical protein Drose_04010 [Dactylosporangium roseum]|uniref:Uncharacterized protein n=1 Tax=Dactylosporangium roseum TaxID=47989 RepID=A0ABY5Z8V9_9ACTN|nr:hypothetical protein [Dactylosporangium roseum]UWZ37453.1 hypothetical protein Drose_04010 [Dactylosporangium roseum]